MRLVGCLLLPTDIRACLYEPGMREGRVQARVEAGPGPRQAHHPRQAAGPLVVVEPSGGHSVVHRCHRLVRQHYHLHFSSLLKLVRFDSSTQNPHCLTRHFELKDQNKERSWFIVLFKTVPY